MTQQSGSAAVPRRLLAFHIPIGAMSIAMAVFAVVCAHGVARAQAFVPAVTELKVGSLAVANDADIFIADAKGYFAAEGLRVVLTTFRSASDMVPLLAAGELDDPKRIKFLKKR